MNDEAAMARSHRYDLALIARRRGAEELPPQYDYHFSLTPDGEEVAQQDRGAPDQAGREIQFFKNVIVRPYTPRGWCIRYPGTAIESTRGDSVEDAYQKCKERGLLSRAEAAPPEPEPEPPQEVEQEIIRIRPGDLFNE
jgi:hypothetical protein